MNHCAVELYLPQLNCNYGPVMHLLLLHGNYSAMELLFLRI